MARSNFSCTGLNLSTSYTGDGICSTALIANAAGGHPIAGTFALTVSRPADAIYEGDAWAKSTESTVNLEHNATAATVQAALEALDNVATVEVKRTRFLPGEGGGGCSYVITFIGSSAAAGTSSGGLSLEVSGDYLNGTRVSATALEVFPGSRWGGEFALSFGGLEGAALPFDARAEEVQEAVKALSVAAGGKQGSVDVWKQEVESGFRWTVAFSGGNLDGDVDLLKVIGGQHVLRLWECFCLVCGNEMARTGFCTVHTSCGSDMSIDASYLTRSGAESAAV